MIGRAINPLKTRSFFLFGPRGSGKTSWLKQTFSPESCVWIDLLDIATQDKLLLDLSLFENWINTPSAQGKTVIVDEIQKFPRLLDTVHKLITRDKRVFALTGSSARRLRQQGVNLLAGRASVYDLFPFSTLELKDSFDLKKALECGGLPEAYLAETLEVAHEYLMSYVHTYLEKEIQQEQWVRRIEPFRRFLAVAAQMNGEILNYSAIAKDVGIDDSTVASYFEILQDTLMGFLLPAFHRSIRKSQRTAPKFYFIDPGIKRALDRTLSVPLLHQTVEFGRAFEHWVILEIKKHASYLRKRWEFSYLRTKDGVEIDLIVDRPGEKRLLIEIKSKSRVLDSDAKALETLGSAVDSKGERLLLSRDPTERRIGKTRAIYWLTALQEIFQR